MGDAVMGGVTGDVPVLYHYTCNHGADGIRADGVIRPYLHPLLTVDTNLVMLAWFTDLPTPDPAEAIGLTSFTLDCDRRAYRFQVDPRQAVWWPTWRRAYLKTTRRPVQAREAVAALENAPGVMPAHWWVTDAAVPAVGADDRAGAST